MALGIFRLLNMYYLGGVRKELDSNPLSFYKCVELFTIKHKTSCIKKTMDWGFRGGGECYAPIPKLQ